MDRRFSSAAIAGRALTLCAALALCACSSGSTSNADDPDANAIAAAGTPEEELSLRSRALQRTVLEGALLGAGLGAAGTSSYAQPIPFGVVVGGTVGVSFGSYLAFLQAKYATNELRLEKMAYDAAETNRETAAAIQTMRVVLDRQTRDLASLRASAPGSPELQAAVTQAESSVNDMRIAIDGAEGRRTELETTKAGLGAAPEIGVVDGQIADLSLRIAEMREIADTLADET